MIYCMACDAQQLSLVGAPCQCGSNSWRGWAQTPVLPKRPEEMTNAELQAEIGRLQQALNHRIYGDPVGGVGLTIGDQNGA